ncbi:MAG: hypothetical protein HKN68_15045 [Saprospiraceae bacterium]|nr:hypothetical protein [Saprospiraceae bacterium]
MKTWKWAILFLLILVMTTIPFAEAISQCPMCRMAAESNLEHGGTEGKGLNTGILYMLSLPYLLVLTIGIIWYRNRKLSQLEEQ